MKACLFDIDGTLVQTGGAGMYAFAEAFAELDGPSGDGSRVVDRAIAGDLLRLHGVGDTAENWARFCPTYVERLQAQLDRCEGRVLPGCVDLIESLKQMPEVHLGLLTGNVRAAAEKKLRHYDVWDHFAFGGFGDNHPDRNDIAADARQAALSRHGSPVAEEQIVVIGDTPNDVRCTRSIGAYAVAVCTGGASHAELAACAPDLLLETLEDHDAILGWLAA